MECEWQSPFLWLIESHTANDASLKPFLAQNSIEQFGESNITCAQFYREKKNDLEFQCDFCTGYC